MTIGVVGRKAGMTRIFTEDGASIPVSVVEVLPNTVYFENLQSGAVFPRPKDNFLNLYEYNRETE